ncbi:protein MICRORCHIDIA 7-like [Chenopodium quinoa]|uniref:protein MICRORCHIDIA 7-like n=1 Tax=Chenopodium quinoa TaxID=63459 RepID=UPI000B796A12|nr:protein MICRORCHIDIA 7-like [Chenopodium quinoa]
MQKSSAMDVQVKQEYEVLFQRMRDRAVNAATPSSAPAPVIDLSDDDDAGDGGAEKRALSSSNGGVPAKKQKVVDGSLPPGFLDPIPSLPESALLLPPVPVSSQGNKQFWKAGDYEGAPCAKWDNNTGGMDHVRVHPKFLHSNATSHKWALGAFAELLDNSLDEVCNGATFVNIDMLINKKDGNKMLLIEDNGGGMDPDKMRQCMSLGYSAKSKLANTIGQYGNGFKTSTMRLGADVIVFSRSCGKDGKSVTQSIGLLSYTFLRSTGKEDIVVPILDYEMREREWQKMMRSSADDWIRNVDTMINWSPYSSETELLQQFNLMKDHGTRIIIYNLWEDDQGLLELDFNSDPHDIQIRGVNRDEKSVEMAKEYPNSKHFLTYRHSLRSYASILYLRLPPRYRMIIRGKDVEHHNVVNDMMMSEEVTYRPQPGADGAPRNADMVAIVTIGFVKDATAHIDVQGFNVYHKNRLIKPFWRVWSAAGSDGRGVIGVLEANFVEPAHDKQGFERTTVLARLENKLVQMQKNYWRTYCHKIGYAPRINKKQLEAGDRESSPDYTPSSRAKSKGRGVDYDKLYSPRSSDKHGGNTVGKYDKYGNGRRSDKTGEKTATKHISVNEKYGNGQSSDKNGEKTSGKHVSVNEKYGNDRTARVRESSEEPSSPSMEDTSDNYELPRVLRKRVNETSHSTLKTLETSHSTLKTTDKDQSGKAFPSGTTSCAVQQEKSANGAMDPTSSSDLQGLVQSEKEKERLQALDMLKEENRILKEKLQVLDELKEENRLLKERLEGNNGEKLDALQRNLQFERGKCKSLETKLHEAECKIEELNKEQESLIDIFSEERDRRDVEEENLRKRLRDASNTIEELRGRVMQLDNMNSSNGRR